jgi:hypothetical protein
MTLAFPYTIANLAGSVPASYLDANWSYTFTLPSQATNVTAGGYTLTGTESVLINAGSTPYGATLAQIASAVGTGTAAQAIKLQTPHTISITGDISYTSPGFDGSGNVTAAGLFNSAGYIAGGSFRNLRGYQTAASTATFAADAIVLETSASSNPAGQSVRLSNFSAPINISSSGLNGLDTGTIAANTWYYVWGIYNPSSTASGGLISLSNTTPSLPTGFTYYALIGCLKTDSTPSVVAFNQYGRRWNYAAAATIATSIATSGAWTSYDLQASKIIPLGTCAIAGSVTSIISNGRYIYFSTASAGGNIAAGIQTNGGAGGQVGFFAGLITSTVYIQTGGSSDAGSGSAFISGFELNL